MELNSRALLLFTKEAELGKVKTRLASSIGAEKALRVYTTLLNYTFSLLEEYAKRGVSVYIYFAEEPQENIDHLKFANIRIQKGVDLGERMQHAFSEVLSQHSSAVILGGDCPELTLDDIESAFQGTEQHHTVIGPSTDGGYYLLGKHTLIPELFTKKKWSTVSVFNDTIADLNRLNQEYKTLQPKTDIDTIDDIILAKASYLLG